MSEARSSEEWAKECIRRGHRNFHYGLAMCPNCARAYAAQKCVALQRRVVVLEGIRDAAVLVAQWVGHSPSCAFRGCTCDSADRLPDALNDFHRQRHLADAALRGGDGM